MKKIAAFALTLLMLLSTVACSSGGQSSETTAAPTVTTAPVVEETEAPETEPPMWAHLPDTKLDGYTFNIIEAEAASATGVSVPQGFAEQMTGDVINDEVYKRNQSVAEHFGVTIKSTVDKAGTIKTTITNLVNANDDSYQLIMLTPGNMQSLALQNSLYNIHDIEHMDLSKPWYSQQQVEDFTIKNKLYYWMGDISYATALFGSAFVYNTTMAEQLQLPDIYELVLSGKWTLDTMIEHTANVSADLNGDTQFTEADDRFALAYRATSNLMNFQYCCGEKFIEYDAATDSFKDVFNMEKMQKLCEKVEVIYKQDNRTLLASDYIALFNAGRALIRGTYLGALFEHRDMTDNFTPIPYPKYDESQEKYHSMMTASCLVMGIPKSVQDTASAGLICEAMSECSAGALKEAVYDRVLSYQTLRDEKSMEVLKLIVDGLIIDFGYLTDTSSYLRWIVGDVVPSGAGAGGLASAFKAKQKVAQTFYGKLLTSYESLT